MKRHETELKMARGLASDPGPRPHPGPEAGAAGPAPLYVRFRGTLRRDPKNPRAAMIRVVHWLLLLLRSPRSPSAPRRRRGTWRSPCLRSPSGSSPRSVAALIAIRALPLHVRRPVVFLVTLAAARRDHGRPRLFPVRHQADPGQRLHFRRLRPETHGRMGEPATSSNGRRNSPRSARCAPIRASSSRRRSPASSPPSISNLGSDVKDGDLADQYRRFGRAGRPLQRPGAA